MISDTLRVLLIEDNPGDARLFRETLSETMGCRLDLTTADRLSTGIDRLRAAEYSIILVDLSLPDSEGLGSLTCVLENAPRIPVVVMTGLDDVDTGTRAVQLGAQDYIVKGRVFGDQMGRLLRHAIERKRLEEKTALSSKILEELNKPTNGEDHIVSILEMIKAFTGFGAVGIRIREGEDYPYYTVMGFPEEFVRLEHTLCRFDEGGSMVRDEQGRAVLACMCGNVIDGRVDATHPFFTARGSFWTNSTTELLAATSDKNRACPTRNTCNSFGYESVALVPLRYGMDTVGLLQLNDMHKGRISLDLVETMEEIGASIGIALARMNNERELHKNAALLSEAQSIGKIGSWEWEPASNKVIWSDGLFRILGYGPGEIEASYDRWMERIHPQDLDVVKEMAGRALKGDREVSAAYRILGRHGEYLHIQSKARVVFDESGRPARVIGYVQDITELALAQNALKESEERYRTLVETSPDAITVTDLKGRIVAANPQTAAIHGFESPQDALGQNALDLIAPEDRERALENFREALSKGQVAGIEYKMLRKDGSTFVGELSVALITDKEGQPKAFIGITRDATDRVRAAAELREKEDQLRQSQKMEAVGSLAGGVAHDFNNLLTVINNYAEFIAEELRDGDPIKADIREIQKAGERAVSLTRQLLAFSRKQVMKPRVLDLNRVVSDLHKMLGRLIGEDIDLRIDLADGLGRIRSDPGQIEQVLMNLVVNARDAMPDGGELTIKTCNAELDEEYARTHCDMAPGHYVMMSVTDSGIGMSDETKERIFEPFFTTKEKGQGTGLGLATVYGIVKQSGGNIWVDSVPGRGTSFTLALPRVEAAETDPPSERSAADLLGTERLLIVEDEPAVREMARRVLTSAGYWVVTAANGGEALLECERDEAGFDLLLTDVVMPQMSGKELANRLARIRPGLKVLYMSGHSEDAVAHRGLLDEGIQFVAKPFTGPELLEKVRTVLDSVSRRPC